MVSVNTNYASMIAQRSFNNNAAELNTSIQRLSTGLRINSALDDPAGLEIAARMTTQINGLNQASANADNGAALLATAESALGQGTELLNQIRVLAVQATNASNSATDRKALQAEVNELKTQFDQIATQTTFNGISLLAGAYNNQVFQIGAFAGQTVTVNVNSARGTAVGNNALTASTLFASNGLGSIVAGALATTASIGIGVAAQNVTINGSGAGIIAVAANTSALTIANQINANSSTTGVTATANNSVTLTSLGNTGTVSFFLANNSGFAGQNVSASITNTSDLTNLRDAINTASSVTGVSATFASAGVTSQLTLTSTDGGNIQLSDFTNTAGAGAIMTLTSVGGNATVLTGAAGANDSANIVGTIALSSAVSYSVQSNVPGSAGGILSGAAGNTAVAATLNTVSAIDISTVANAQTAMATVDQALERLNSQRANLGALVSRFQSSSANSTNTAINISQARSVIRDADFAEETANFTRLQIISQAANSMLSQANSAPQSVLRLIQNL